MSIASLDELAIFGGSPAFEEPLHVGRPAIGDIEQTLKRIRSALENRWLTNNGPLVQEFERRVCEYIGVEHCVAVCNGTVGLELAIRGLEMKGRVIVPSFTFAATAQSLSWMGLEPLFCDIDLETHCLDPESVEAALNSHRVGGILGVHLWGIPCDVERLTELATEFEVPLLFDAAQAFGSQLGLKRVGGFGNAEVFSFHATKVVNSFEGGAIATNDSVLAKKLRSMRNFGFDETGDQAVTAGTNGKMSEAAAAMGLTSLESVDESISANRRNLEQYRKRLDLVSGVSLMERSGATGSNCHYVVVEVDNWKTEITRDEMVEILTAENILAKRYFASGCHQSPLYSNEATTSLPKTESVGARVLQLPTGVNVSIDDVNLVCDLIELCVSKGVEIAERMRG